MSPLKESQLRGAPTATNNNTNTTNTSSTTTNTTASGDARQPPAAMPRTSPPPPPPPPPPLTQTAARSTPARRRSTAVGSACASAASLSPLTPFAGPAICLKLHFAGSTRYAFVPDVAASQLSFEYVSRLFELEFPEYSRFSHAPEFFDGAHWVQVSGDPRLQAAMAAIVRNRIALISTNAPPTANQTPIALPTSISAPVLAGAAIPNRRNGQQGPVTTTSGIPNDQPTRMSISTTPSPSPPPSTTTNSLNPQSRQGSMSLGDGQPPQQSQQQPQRSTSLLSNGISIGGGTGTNSSTTSSQVGTTRKTTPIRESGHPVEFEIASPIDMVPNTSTVDLTRIPPSSVGSRASSGWLEGMFEHSNSTDSLTTYQARHGTPNGLYSSNNVDGQLLNSGRAINTGNHVLSNTNGDDDQNKVLLNDPNGGGLYPQYFHLELRARELSIDELGLSHVSSAFVIDRVATRLYEQLALIRNIRLRLSHVRRIMVFSKPDDMEVAINTRFIVTWMLSTYEHIQVFLSPDLETDNEYFSVDQLVTEYPEFAERIGFWDSTPEFTAKGNMDLVITIGGDGTVLHASYVFQERVPPVVSFAMGSLGFLTNFDVPMCKEIIGKIVDGTPMAFQLRMRLNCKVCVVPDDKRREYIAQSGLSKFNVPCNRISAIRRHVNGFHSRVGGSTPAALSSSQLGPPSTSYNSLLATGAVAAAETTADCGECAATAADGNDSNAGAGDYFGKHLDGTDHGDIVKQLDYNNVYEAHNDSEFELNVLNEFVVDRGANPGLTMIELFADDVRVTTIQADGLVVATATGSTAYSLSAGGSLVHPEKHTILVTPICSHTLTTRPIHLPGNVKLRLTISAATRAPAWASFDGRCRMQLNPLDSVVITASTDPFLQIMRQDATVDWFNSLSSRLHWNERFIQKPMFRRKKN